ncbi:dihydroorotase [Wenzhouxiangella limi]|uniref:Dihydroorotase n=1 Tax=Wenzhouxiangella limi TaxID=2707351 RepID=A0A845UVC0_9GAMM|nr:dihydroorotase [Wenzhouxiangella limi]
MQSLTLTRPDDWHLHVRDGAMLKSVVPDTARQFARAIIMPNLKPPVATVDLALAYRERILAAVPESMHFQPLMTLYLTEQTSPDEIRRAAECEHVHAVKYYPAGATTNAASGVRVIDRVWPVLEAMQEVRLPLLMHGEVTEGDIDVFDREAVFIDRHLTRLVEAFPELPMVLEHITTKDSADFVRQGPSNLAATITAHHLLLNRNAMFDGGLRPHHYCLPLIKRERHRQALVEAATSGNPKFFLGTDSAPHPKGAKESDCGCAGIYSARNAMGFYAEVFEDAGALDKLEGFASHYGPAFYGINRNADTITLLREQQAIPEQVDFGGESGVPLRAGGAARWRLAAEVENC